MRSIINRLAIGFFTLTVGIVMIVGCKKESKDNQGQLDGPPSLLIKNESTDHWPIKAVEMVGYTFNLLEIDKGESQTFTLDNGMPGGYSDINLIVRYGPTGAIWYASKKVDFSDGQVTTVSMKGCRSSEGCPGIYLE